MHSERDFFLLYVRLDGNKSYLLNMVCLQFNFLKKLIFV